MNIIRILESAFLQQIIYYECMKKLYLYYIYLWVYYYILIYFLLLTFLSTLTTYLLDVCKNLMTHTTVEFTIFPNFSFTLTRVILSITNVFYTMCTTLRISAVIPRVFYSTTNFHIGKSLSNFPHATAENFG